MATTCKLLPVRNKLIAKWFLKRLFPSPSSTTQLLLTHPRPPFYIGLIEPTTQPPTYLLLGAAPIVHTFRKDNKSCSVSIYHLPPLFVIFYYTLLWHHRQEVTQDKGRHDNCSFPLHLPPHCPTPPHWTLITAG